jgi:hypothetical protein
MSISTVTFQVLRHGAAGGYTSEFSEVDEEERKR